MYIKNFIFQTEAIPPFLYLFMETDHMFYQRETLSKYPKAKTIQDISLTTLQEN